jgi:hypothetical protein
MINLEAFRQQENCLPKPKELAGFKLANSSMA